MIPMFALVALVALCMYAYDIYYDWRENPSEVVRKLLRNPDRAEKVKDVLTPYQLEIYHRCQAKIQDIPYSTVLVNDKIKLAPRTAKFSKFIDSTFLRRGDLLEIIWIFIVVARFLPVILVHHLVILRHVRRLVTEYKATHPNEN